MPLYSYKCTSCGATPEFLQKTSDPPKMECPNCLQLSLRKQLTTPDLQFNGSGWHAARKRGE